MRIKKKLIGVQERKNQAVIVSEIQLRSGNMNSIKKEEMT